MASLLKKKIATTNNNTKDRAKASTAIATQVVVAPVVEEAKPEAKATESLNKILVQNQHARALKIGSQIDADTDAEVRSVVAAGDAVKSGALWHMFNLMKLFGEDDMTGWPVPRSDKGNNPDKMTTNVKDVATGETKSVTTYFYVDVFDASPYGSEIVDTLAKLDKSIAAVAKSDRAPEYKDWNATDLGPERKTVANRRSGGVALYRKAMDCFFQIQAINELSNHVGMKIAQVIEEDDDGQRVSVNSKGRYPFKLWNIANPDDDRKSLSVSQFLNLDPAVALENGGTFDALLETAKRGADDETAEAEAEPWTLAEAESNAAMFLHFLDQKENIVALFKRLNTKKPEASNDFLKTLGDIRVALNDFLAPSKPLGARYYRLIETVPSQDDNG